ncbi:MAG: hypothetical protein Q8M01_13895 [Rubrivivax sp.]|nr:hypothetical protein [Rubrivivax sp.]
MTGAQGRYDTVQGLLAAWRLADPLHIDGARWARALPWVLAALATAGLLLSLSLVVQNIVSQAALRHAATAMQTDALWRCNALTERDVRDHCRRLAVAATTPTAN